MNWKLVRQLLKNKLPPNLAKTVKFVVTKHKLTME